MKKAIWPMAMAGLFLLGLMVNIGCPAPGGTGQQGGSSMCGGSMPPQPANCQPGTVDHHDGKGCVKGKASGGGRGGGSGGGGGGNNSGPVIVK